MSSALPLDFMPTVDDLILSVIASFSFPTIYVELLPVVMEDEPDGKMTFSIFVPGTIPKTAPVNRQKLLALQLQF